MRIDVSTTQVLELKQRTAATRSVNSRLTGRLRGRGLMLVAGISVLGVGMALNWDWLTAMGAAPSILALAPCALMCTFGICCGKEGNQA